MAASGQAARHAWGCSHGFQHSEFVGKKYVVYFDDQRCWLSVSPGVCELLGRSQEELVGKKLDAFVPDELGINPELFREFLDDGYQTFVLAMVRADGKLVGVRAHARRMEDGCLAMWCEKL